MRLGSLLLLFFFNRFPFLYGFSSWISSLSSIPLPTSWYWPRPWERSIWSYVVQQSSRFRPWCKRQRRKLSKQNKSCSVCLKLLRENENMDAVIFVSALSEVDFISSWCHDLRQKSMIFQCSPDICSPPWPSFSSSLVLLGSETARDKTELVNFCYALIKGKQFNYLDDWCRKTLRTNISQVAIISGMLAIMLRQHSYLEMVEINNNVKKKADLEQKSSRRYYHTQ